MEHVARVTLATAAKEMLLSYLWFGFWFGDDKSSLSYLPCCRSFYLLGEKSGPESPNNCFVLAASRTEERGRVVEINGVVYDAELFFALQQCLRESTVIMYVGGNTNGVCLDYVCGL